jgi:histidyl-tRNA synthetase
VKIQAQRGTEDVLPAEVHRWRFVEQTFARVAAQAGFEEIRVPTFEDIELFKRTSGETSDVVSKEMFDFVDKGGRHVALKPEGTASTVRAFIEHSLGAAGLPVRLWYCDSFFRYGRPQKGRLRELHQVGLELLGSATPEADVELIETTVRFYRALGVTDCELRINNIGDATCRARFGEAVLAHLAPWLSEADPETQAKARKNPMRLLDSKDPAVKGLLADAPAINGFRSETSVAHHAAVCNGLARAGVTFVEDPLIVRGLDYYNDTVFEIVGTGLGSQDSLCGGGRYDGLVGLLGGPATPAVGVGCGVERALLALATTGSEPPRPQPDAYVVAASEDARATVETTVRRLREAGLAALYDLDGRSLKAQFKSADRVRARYAVVFGDEELASGEATIKVLATGEQSRVSTDRLEERLR